MPASRSSLRRYLVEKFNQLIGDAPRGSFPHPIKLVIDDETALQGRDPCGRGQAASTADTVYIAAKLLAAHRDRQFGVLMHELAHVSFLQRGIEEHTEREADVLAESFWNTPINYDEEDVQTIGPGVTPRPARLDAKENPILKWYEKPEFLALQESDRKNAGKAKKRERAFVETLSINVREQLTQLAGRTGHDVDSVLKWVELDPATGFFDTVRWLDFDLPNGKGCAQVRSIGIVTKHDVHVAYAFETSKCQESDADIYDVASRLRQDLRAARRDAKNNPEFDVVTYQKVIRRALKMIPEVITDEDMRGYADEAIRNTKTCAVKARSLANESSATTDKAARKLIAFVLRR
jgi:hypothetical protein